MAEREPGGLEHDQPGVLGRGEGVIGEPRARERAADHDRAVGPARGEEKQRLAARVRQGLDHTGVGLLEARVAAFEAPAVGARELEQRRAGSRRHRAPPGRPVRRQPTVLKQRAGLVGSQQFRADGRQLGVALRARRDQEGDAVCGDAPPGKRDRLRRRRVKPVGVVDQREHRLLLRSGAEQVEGADEHRQPVDRLGRPDGEGAPQRLGLASRQVWRKAGQRCEEVDEPDEWHRCLGLDAARPHHAHVLGARSGVLEERGFADPRLARTTSAPPWPLRASPSSRSMRRHSSPLPTACGRVYIVASAGNGFRADPPGTAGRRGHGGPAAAVMRRLASYDPLPWSPEPPCLCPFPFPWLR